VEQNLTIARDIRDIKSNLNPVSTGDGVYVVVYAVSIDTAKNRSVKIPCKHGIPIGGYVYDAVSDAYVIKCIDYANLGVVPISYKLSLPESGNWTVCVPSPERVLKRYMNNTQKSDLKRFKRIMGAECKYEFLQMTSHE
jgi:hypothetical protein